MEDRMSELLDAVRGWMKVKSRIAGDATQSIEFRLLREGVYGEDNTRALD